MFSSNGLGLAGTAAGSRQGSSVQSHLMPSLASSFSFLFLVKSEQEHPRRGVADRPPWHGTEFDGLLRIRYVLCICVVAVGVSKFETLVFYVALT